MWRGDALQSNEDLSEGLATHINGVIRALIVAGRKGAPAEGRIPLNPLDFIILRVLGAEGPWRPSHISDRLAVSRTTISTAVKALTRREFIATRPDDLDGRALLLGRSAEGNEVLAVILRQDRRNAAAMLGALDATDRGALVTEIGKVADRVAAG